MKSFPLVCLMLCLLIACAELPAPTPELTLARTEVAQVTPTAVSTPTSPPPTNTPTPTATLHPTVTPTPTPTPTLVPVLSGTAVPPSTAAIIPENVSQVTELARWGRGVINDVAVSGNGRWLAVGTTTGVYIHDAQDLTIEPRFFETPDSVTALAISYEGDLVAMSFNQRTFELWNIQTNNRLEHREGFTEQIQFSPDGRYLAAVVGPDGFVWSVLEVTVVQSYPGVLSMKFSGDGSRLAVWTYGEASVYSWPDGALLEEAEPELFLPNDDSEYKPEGTVLSDIQFAANNQPILLSLPTTPNGTTGHVELQSSDNALLLSLLPIDRLSLPIQDACNLPIYFADPPGSPQVWQFEYLPEVQIVALDYSDSGYSGDYFKYSSVQFYKLDSGRRLYVLEEGIQDFAFMPDGETWVAGLQDGRLQIRRITDGEVLQEFDGYESPILNIAASPDNETVAVEYLDEVKLYSASDGEMLQRLPAGKVAFSADGTTLALGTQGGNIQLYNTADGTLQTTLSSHTEAITALTYFASDERLVSAGMDCQLNVWQVADGSLIEQLDNYFVPGLTGEELVPLRVWELAVTPDNETLIGSISSAIGFWNLSEGTFQNIVEPQNHLVDIAFSPVRNQLAAAGYPAFLWQISPEAGVEELWQIETSDEAVAFSPDGQLLLFGLDENYYDENRLPNEMRNGAIRIVVADTVTLLQLLTPGTRKVTALVFNEAGSTLYSGSLDGVVHLWGIPTSN
ncbi:MAG: WD40 repeat domain-containing protein [Anaerolineales bacterium]|nr:WD40 repeat domain-containing protein [Anaerolineales bacterium]